MSQNIGFRKIFLPNMFAEQKTSVKEHVFWEKCCQMFPTNKTSEQKQNASKNKFIKQEKSCSGIVCQQKQL